MKRRELFRRSALASLGIVVGGPVPRLVRAAPRKFPKDYDASARLGRDDWRPVFLSDHQNETLVVLSDLIIPETETPGARSAYVNRFIDYLLAAETRENQRKVLESLAYLDGESRKRFGSAFVFIGQQNQIDFLTFHAYPHRMVTWGDNESRFTGHQHFLHLKEWIVRAFYSSEAGMKDLGWDESPFHGPFLGCRHNGGNHG